jgi:uncharacterized protein YcbK (DUF882 family)
MSAALELERFIDRLGLRHFKGREFTPYWSRARGGVRNGVPPEALWPNIVKTLLVLDELRDALGAPITLTSTYRRPAYNAAVGGEPASYHMRFMAVDFQCRAATPRRCAELLRRMRGRRLTLPGNGGAFLFRGGIGTYATFTHVDTRGRDANWTG